MIAVTPEDAEWYTPPDLLSAVYETIGIPDLDPACNPDGEPNVKAKKYFRKCDDGLSHDWVGTVFLNPPYGRSIPAWIQKLVSEYIYGDVIAAIALVPNKTDTNWWLTLAGNSPALCAIHRRVRYLTPDRKVLRQGTFGSAAVLLASDTRTIARFEQVWGRFGMIWTPKFVRHGE